MDRWMKVLLLFVILGHSWGICPSFGSVDKTVTVFVSIPPLKYFVEKIGGNRVDVSVMVPPGANPAVYEPKPAQMARLSGAQVFFAVGVPFESVWLSRFSAANPGMKIVHTEAGIEKIQMAPHVHDGHENEKGHSRHGMPDPHVWTAPPRVKIMADNIHAAMTHVDPGGKAFYDANHREFVSEIEDLDQRLRQVFAEIDGERKAFMVFHPAWGYFADTYGLEQIPVEIEGKDPKPAQLQKIIAHARARDIRVIFVQPQFSARSAQTVADAIGGRVVAADPLAADWADNLWRQALQFKAAME